MTGDIVDTGNAQHLTAMTSASPSTERLAVYGSLAPGCINYHVLEHLGGTWQQGIVHGHLHEAGWGSLYGFPGIALDPRGPAVPVQMLTAEALASYWAELDSFEGEGYVRVETDVALENGDVVRAWIYVLAPAVLEDTQTP